MAMTATPQTTHTRFRAVVEAAGRTATGIRVPPDAVAALGSGKQPPVRVTINGHTYPSRIAVRGGDHLIPVSAENRAAAGVAAGDEVEVAIALDTAPRELRVPDDFSAALDAAPDARRFFDGLSFSQRQWFVLGVEGAKTEATRQRRIAKAIERLAEGRGNR